MTSNESAPSFDPIWEEIYRSGEQLNKYPYDGVVVFMNRVLKATKRSAEQCRLIEIGCGAGNNIWFAAREGFEATGIDMSQSALAHARARLKNDALSAKFVDGDFTKLPLENETFDVALSRAAITQTGRSSGRKACDELLRVLKPGGYLYSEIYSTESSTRGAPGPDGTLVDVEGPMSGVGQICLYDRPGIEFLFETGWEIIDLVHRESKSMLQEAPQTTAVWCVTTRKKEKS